MLLLLHRARDFILLPAYAYPKGAITQPNFYIKLEFKPAFHNLFGKIFSRVC